MAAPPAVLACFVTKFVLARQLADNPPPQQPTLLRDKLGINRVMAATAVCG